MPALPFIFLRLRRTLFLLAAVAVASVHAAESVLEIAVGSQIHQFVRSDLLSSPAAQTIEIFSDVAYKRAMHYRAAPLSSLIPQLKELGVLQFTTLDGFVANIPAKTFAGRSRAWVAIEPADTP